MKYEYLKRLNYKEVEVIENYVTERIAELHKFLEQDDNEKQFRQNQGGIKELRKIVAEIKHFTNNKNFSN